MKTLTRATEESLSRKERMTARVPRFQSWVLRQGTGGMLLEAVHHVRLNRGDDRTLWGKVFTQEKNLTTSTIARMNLFLHGASDFQVIRGDTLRQPFFSGDNLATFDCVIANPPFSLEKWGEEVWASDPYGRKFAGMPPGKSGDYAQRSSKRSRSTRPVG